MKRFVPEVYPKIGAALAILAGSWAAPWIAPAVAAEAALVLESVPASASATATAAGAGGGAMRPATSAAAGCAEEPHDGGFESGLGFQPSQTAANIAQRFELPAPAAGAEWFLDDVCLAVTRNGSPGTSAFTFAVFRDDGGLPGDVLTFRGVEVELSVFPGSTVCLGDFSYPLVGHDAIHVGIAWNPQEIALLLMMDRSAGTSVETVSARSSATGPEGLGGWSPATAADPAIRAAGVGITLFSSTPRWVTTALPPLDQAASTERLGDLGSAPAAFLEGAGIAAPQGADELTLLGGVATEARYGSLIVAILVFGDPANLTTGPQSWYSYLGLSDDPAAGIFTPLELPFPRARFLGDELVRWHGDPDLFAVPVVDDASNLLLLHAELGEPVNAISLATRGIDDLPGYKLDIDFETIGGNVFWADLAATKRRDNWLAVHNHNFTIGVWQQPTPSSAWVRIDEISVAVGGSNGALGPALASTSWGINIFYAKAKFREDGSFDDRSFTVNGRQYPSGQDQTYYEEEYASFGRDLAIAFGVAALGGSLPASQDPDLLLAYPHDGGVKLACLEWDAADWSYQLQDRGSLLLGGPLSRESPRFFVDTFGTNLNVTYPTDLNWRQETHSLTFGCSFPQRVAEEEVPEAVGRALVAIQDILNTPGGLDFFAEGFRPQGSRLRPAAAPAAVPRLAIGERREPRPCNPGAGIHCLTDKRFGVQVGWRTSDGRTGFGRALGLTDETGLFTFFGPDNVELVVKTLNACGTSFNSHWVFTAGLTDVEHGIEVFDSQSGSRRHYVNPQKTAAQPVQDTEAFATCPLIAPGAPDSLLGGAILAHAAIPAAGPDGTLPAWARDALANRRLASRLAAPVNGACTPGPTALCLNDGRFQVEVEWATATDAGQGQAIDLTDDTGAFWFFGAENVEVLIKVLDACGPPFERFWVFAAGLTNVEVKLTVTDTLTGTPREYRNLLDRPFLPIQDTDAFATCP